ncbi:hypothetical protein CKO28_02640 [Rhodovibrio sodomensis]|uniref:Uncharacterized protein n=1 Tax=Rhodovibrio sodomensis TaxID=1088 RepID=A0ABS1D9C2_9PROT|nr:hypothetical protein [Rhodovibrio sodomensis]MBK1666940.1 hypothetical protein [Rhodovibrio sodomensis]
MPIGTMMRISLTAAALAVAGVLAVSLTPRDALACPPGCPSPIHPCCCPSPCPVQDGQKNGILSSIQQHYQEVLTQYGISLPSLDALANPMACLTGSAPSLDLSAAAGEMPDFGSIGMFPGDSGFTELPGFDFSQVTDGMANDLGALGDSLGVNDIDLGLDGLDLGVGARPNFGAPGSLMPDIGDLGNIADHLPRSDPEFGKLFNPDFSQFGTPDFGQLTEGFNQDLSALGSDLGDLSGLSNLPGLEDLGVSPALGQLGSIEGVNDIADLKRLANLAQFKDLDALRSLDIPAMDLARLSEIPGIEDAGDIAELQRLADQLNLDGITSAADLGQLIDHPGFDDLDDLMALGELREIPGLDSLEDAIGLGKLGDLPGIPGLEGLPGMDFGQIMQGLPDIGALGDLMNFQNDPMAAVSAVANCAANFTPVNSGMIEGAAILGSLQQIRNAFAGPGAENTITARVPDADLQVPEIMLPAEQRGHVAASMKAGTESLASARMRTHREMYIPSRSVAKDQDVRAKRKDNLRKVATAAYARAIAKKEHLGDPDTASLSDLEQRIMDAANAAEDMRINAEIRSHVAAAFEEYNELLATYLELKAATQIATDPDIMHSPPSNTMATAAAALTEAERAEINAGRQLQARVRAYDRLLTEAIREHNALESLQNVQAQRPALLTTVKEHEARKDHMLSLEREIVQHLSTLYIDPRGAWEILKSDLRGPDTTGYADGNRYAVASASAGRVIPELLAQAPTTRYGARIPNNCTPMRKDPGACVPFRTGSFLAAQGRSKVNSYYAGSWDRYKPDVPRPTGEDRTVPHYTNLYLAMQYWLEAHKRKTFWDDLRRGDPKLAGTLMTGDLYDELRQNATSCFMGPLPATQGNLNARPDLFDVAPDCEHHTWSSGPFEGAQINHLQLGGADQSLWMIRNAELEHQLRFGGRERIQQLMDEMKAIEDSGLAGDLDAAGRGDLASWFETMVSKRAEIAADPEATKRIARVER